MGLFSRFAKQREHNSAVGGASGFEKIRLVVREDYRYFSNGMVAKCPSGEYEERANAAVLISEVFVQLTDGYYRRLAEVYKKAEGRDPYAELADAIVSNKEVVLNIAARMFGVAFGIVLLKASKVVGRRILEENVVKYVETWGIDSFYRGEVAGYALKYVRFVEGLNGNEPIYNQEFGEIAYGLFYSRLGEEKMADPMINTRFKGAAAEAYEKVKVDGVMEYFIEVGLIGSVY